MPAAKKASKLLPLLASIPDGMADISRGNTPGFQHKMVSTPAGVPEFVNTTWRFFQGARITIPFISLCDTVPT